MLTGYRTVAVSMTYCDSGTRFQDPSIFRKQMSKMVQEDRAIVTIGHK